MAVGIEQADLDVRVRVQPRDEIVFLLEGFPVVQQQSHPYAAIGGGDQPVNDERAGLISVEDVVLEVERALGEVDEQRSGDERIESIGE